MTAVRNNQQISLLLIERFFHFIRTRILFYTDILFVRTVELRHAINSMNEKSYDLLLTYQDNEVQLDLV